MGLGSHAGLLNVYGRYYTMIHQHILFLKLNIVYITLLQNIY